jgi:competence protein ComEA
METSAPWRALEVPEGEPGGAGRAAENPKLAGHRLVLLAAAALAAASLGAAALVASQAGGEIQVVASSSDTPAIAAASAEMLIVQVSGAVVRPGLYSLPAGSRVGDAISAAGGFAPDVDPRAAEAQLNLAAKLQDAQSIHVPRRGDAASAASAGANHTKGLVNLNTATAAELDVLPGIGPATAQKIIAAREQAPFKSVNDLVTRKIVTTATLAKLRSLVTVG